MQWYLQQVCADQAATGTRPVDYLDIHYYPQADGVAGTDNIPNEGVAPTRFRSLRELWDPTYLSESWIGAIPDLVPRLRAWIAGFRGPEVAAAQIPWRALGTLVAAALVVHLGIASAYLSFTTRAREHELGGLGGEVAALLKQQRQVERMSAEKAAIGTLLRERHPAHEPWRIAAVAWGHGAQIARLNFVDGVLTVTGTAPAATDVLAALAATPGVSEAKFVAPVRREQADREEFSISMRIAGGVARGG